LKAELINLLKKRGGDYSYAYGVVSGKSSKLLSYHQTENLALFKSLDEVATFLSGTEYEQDIQGAMGKMIDADKLEKGILSGFMRIYNEIAVHLPPGDRNTLAEMTMGYIGTTNLQVAIRMVHSKANPEEIKKMLSPGRWGNEFTDDIVGSGSIRDLLEKLKGTKYEVLVEEIEEYEKTKNTISLEVRLEKLLVKRWLALKDTMSPDLQSYIAKNIDMMNITYALRITEEHVDAKDIFIEGGKYVSREMFERMAKSSPSDAVEILHKTPFYNAAKEGIGHFEKAGSFIKLENLLNGVIIKRFADDALFRPLSMSSIILFIARKRMEIKNLRRIIVCIAGKIPANEIKEMLVRV